MKKFFDLDNPLMQGLAAIANIMLLSCLWILFSIPIITVGASTAALYYVTQKEVQGENPSIFSGFFKSFRENLKQGTVLTLIFGAAAALIYYDYLFSYMVEGLGGSFLRAVFIVFAAVWLMAACYAFPLQAQFVNSVKNTLKNALFIGLAHPGRTVLLIAVNLIPAAVCLALPDLFVKLLPVWVFCAPGGIAYICALLRKKVWASLIGKTQEAEREKAEISGEIQ